MVLPEIGQIWSYYRDWRESPYVVFVLEETRKITVDNYMFICYSLTEESITDCQFNDLNCEYWERLA